MGNCFKLIEDSRRSTSASEQDKRRNNISNDELSSASDDTMSMSDYKQYIINTARNKHSSVDNYKPLEEEDEEGNTGLRRLRSLGKITRESVEKESTSSLVEITNQQLESLVTQLKLYSFDNDRIALVQKTLGLQILDTPAAGTVETTGLTLTCEQASQIVSSMVFSPNKLMLVKCLCPRITDLRKNYKLLLSAITFEMDRVSSKKYIKQYIRLKQQSQDASA